MSEYKAGERAALSTGSWGRGGEGGSGERPRDWPAGPAAPGLAPRARPRAGKAGRPGLAGPAVTQRQHVRAAAPSVSPPPSPRAWQEKRATWSGNKGPRGPRRSGTRCHLTLGPGRRCGPGSTPRPHAPGPGSPLVGESRPGQNHTLGIGSDSGSRHSRALLPEGRSSLPRGACTQAPELLPPSLPCPSALSEAAGTRPRPPPPSNHGSGRSAGPPGASLTSSEGGGGFFPHPRYLSGHRSAPPTLSAAAAPSPGSDTGRALSLLRRGREPRSVPGSCLKRWKNSSLELRRGAAGSGRVQAQRKAPRGRRGGKRSSGRASWVRPRGWPGEGSAAEGSRALARSPAGTAARKQQAEKRRPVAPRDRPPRASRRHCRRRRRSRAPHPPRTSPRAPPPPPTLRGRSGSNLSANHRRAPERRARGPAHPARPRARARRLLPASLK